LARFTTLKHLSRKTAGYSVTKSSTAVFFIETFIQTFCEFRIKRSFANFPITSFTLVVIKRQETFRSDGHQNVLPLTFNNS